MMRITTKSNSTFTSYNKSWSSWSARDAILQKIYINYQLNKTPRNINPCSSKRLSSPTSTINYPGAWVYPDECGFCKLHAIKVNGKQQTPHIVVQRNAVNTIKAAAKLKDPDVYNEVVNLDVFAKEFKYHTKSYNSFAYWYSSSILAFFLNFRFFSVFIINGSTILCSS